MNQNLFTTTFLKAFDIIDCFDSDDQEIGISEIASMVNYPVSSVHRIIQSLEFEGMLQQNSETKRYRLGTKLLSLSKKCNQLERYQAIAEPFVDALAAETGETVNLSIRTCDQITHIYKVDSKFVLRPSFSLNLPFPAYSTSVGRALLAELSDAELEWIYEKNREDISMPLPDFLNLMHEVRQNGYALDDEEFNTGLRCVGAPVRLADGTAIFAISVSAPSARVNDAAYLCHRELVMDFAQRISDALADAAMRRR